MEDKMKKLLTIILLCLTSTILLIVLTVYAQTDSWRQDPLDIKTGKEQEHSAANLEGVIDVHIHYAPDSELRALDALEAARIALRYGMRALLFKNHHTQTASLAYLVSQAVTGIEAYGGIALNSSVGGINPIAVERMARTTGRLGRVVWMPTRDSEHYTKTLEPNPHFVPISRNGELLPEVKEVLAVMAREDLALGTGHSSPAESLLLIREAKSMGIERIIVTHPMARAVGMTVEQQVEAARMGAYLEYCFVPLLPYDTGKIKPEGALPIEELVTAIRAVGPAHAIISTDLGQPLNPVLTDGMIAFIRQLKAQAFTQKEIDQMSKINPAKFLGLQ